MRREFSKKIALTVLFASATALAQVQVQQGNVLDANPQLGSGGLNYGARRYQFNTSNRIVTGNAAGGASFRGFSPIRDSSSFFVGSTSGTYLPSDSLAQFNRDSSSYAQVPRPAIGPIPYYAPQTTVLSTGGIVAGLNQPGSSQLKTPYMVPRPDLRAAPANPLTSSGAQMLGTALSVAPELARIDTGQRITGPVNTRLLGSPLFGAVRTVPLDVLASEAQRASQLGTTDATPAVAVDPRVSRLEPLDLRGVREKQDHQAAGAMPATPATVQPWQTPAPEAQVIDSGNTLNESPQSTAVPHGGSVGDVFAGMRQAVGQLVRPLEPVPTLTGQARTEAEARQADRTQLAQPIAPATAAPEQAPQQTQPPTLSEMGRPLRSFVGTEQSTINRYLAQAEARLRAGRYYEAAAIYDLARTVDPRNPLPLLGEALALLAAGDYMTSATDLLQAIRLFEDLAKFRVDLKAFLPDLAALDRRRADLERQLDRMEDYRLRFLLGFAEYSSGFEKLGLDNMRKAAAAAPPDWAVVRRFVSSLQSLPATSPAGAVK